MIANPLAFYSNLIYSILFFVIIIRASKLIGKNERSMTAVFFTFSITSLALSYLYWLAYDLLRPEIRMPFAANEVGEMACNLLLASALTTVFSDKGMASYKEAIWGIALQIACIFLWIGWSGEWIQDIVSGVALCYLVYMIVKALIVSEAFGRADWIFQGVAITALVALEGLTFALVGDLNRAVDTICYVLIFAICAYYLYKAFTAFRKNADSKVLLSISCVGFLYGMNAMYMSSEPIYYAAELFDNVMLLLTAIAVKRVVMDE